MTNLEIGLIVINIIQVIIFVPMIILLINNRNKSYNTSSKELRTFINTLEIDILKFKEKNTFKKER